MLLLIAGESSMPGSRAAQSREATLVDIDHIEALTLDDFAIDADQIQLPFDTPINDFELQRAANQSITGSSIM